MKKLIITKKWIIDFLDQTQETGMGYLVCTVVTSSKKYERTVIVQNEETYTIIDVDGYDGIPFTEDDIKEIIPTHEKSD
jgi:hypothetical protein